MRWFFCSVPFRCVGYQGQFLSHTLLSEYILCAGVPFTDCVRPIGFTSKKAKAYPDDCLLQRCIDCGTVLCFSVFPYDAENEFIRICEAFEGIAVFTMLILLVTKINDGKYGRRALFVIVLLELAIAVLNTALPMASITEDIQIIDIPMNYLALYMRPVIFSSIALIYRIWLDLQEAWGQKENR